jgi:uncharacterized protein YbaP (TraB family)
MRLSKFWLLAFLALLLIIPRVGHAGEKHCLWKIESGESKVYLLGSIHMMKEEQYPLAQAIEDAFEASDGIVFEADIDSLQDPARQMELMTKGIYAEGDSLKHKISLSTYEEVRKRVISLGMPMEPFETFRPWLIALTLTVLEAQKLGFQAQYGLDIHFHGRAKESQKEIGALETVEFQIGLFSGIPEERQEAFLKYSLAELDLMAEVLGDLVQAWESGNIKELDSIFVQRMVGAEEWSDLVKLLVFDRNEDWVPKIEKLLASGKSYLVVVGALHLVGKGSVVDLLREKGHTIEQL